MGGPLPIHITMAFYSGFVFLRNINIKQCTLNKKLEDIDIKDV